MEQLSLEVLQNRSLMDPWRTYFETSQRLKVHLDKSLHAEMRSDLEEYNFFLVLNEAPNRTLRLAELAERLVFSFSRLNYRVGQLVKRGYVVKEICEEDRRSQRITMTELGREHFRELAKAHDRHLARVLGPNITQTDLEQMAELVKKFTI